MGQGLGQPPVPRLGTWGSNRQRPENQGLLGKTAKSATSRGKIGNAKPGIAVAGPGHRPLVRRELSRLQAAPSRKGKGAGDAWPRIAGHGLVRAQAPAGPPAGGLAIRPGGSPISGPCRPGSGGSWGLWHGPHGRVRLFGLRGAAGRVQGQAVEPAVGGRARSAIRLLPRRPRHGPGSGPACPGPGPRQGSTIPVPSASGDRAGCRKTPRQVPAPPGCPGPGGLGAGPGQGVERSTGDGRLAQSVPRRRCKKTTQQAFCGGPGGRLAGPSPVRRPVSRPGPRRERRRWRRTGPGRRESGVGSCPCRPGQ